MLELHKETEDFCCESRQSRPFPAVSQIMMSYQNKSYAGNICESIYFTMVRTTVAYPYKRAVTEL